MSVKIVTVAKQLPKYSSDTVEILPMLDTWLYGQETRFIKKVKKIFEGAAVNTRYSIMDPIEVFTATSFEDKNNIYSREVIILGEQVLEKALKKSGMGSKHLRLYYYCKLHRYYNPFFRCVSYK